MDLRVNSGLEPASKKFDVTLLVYPQLKDWDLLSKVLVIIGCEEALVGLVNDLR